MKTGEPDVAIHPSAFILALAESPHSKLARVAQLEEATDLRSV